MLLAPRQAIEHKRKAEDFRRHRSTTVEAEAAKSKADKLCSWA